MVHLPVELGAWICNSCIHRWLYKMHTYLLEAEFGEFLLSKIVYLLQWEGVKKKAVPNSYQEV